MMQTPVPPNAPAGPATGADRFLAVADAIGCRLCRDAVWSGDRCSWMIVTMDMVDGGWQPVRRAASIDLYAGVSGIALMLAMLAQRTGDPLQARVRDGAVRQILARLSEGAGPAFTGLYDGVTGAGLTLVDIGEITGDGGLVERGLDLVEEANGRPAPGHALDLLSGVAGAIPVLVDLSARYGRRRMLEQALRHGQTLVDAAQESDEGISWPGVGLAPGARNLLGLSHGTAGIACGLLELNRVMPDQRWRRAAEGALRYERHHFNAAASNWPDFRGLHGGTADQPGCPCAWCHGAPGVGLGRLRVLELLPDDAEAVTGEVNAALQTTWQTLNAMLAAGTVGDFSYCHGATGLADFLLETALRLGRPDIRQAADAVGDFGAAAYANRRAPWPCGVMNAGETPGLFLGIAGIAHFYLRLHAPETTASLLLPTARRAEEAAAARGRAAVS